MTTFKVTKQNEIFGRDGGDHAFHIKDDLLFNCIGMGRGNGHDPKKVSGFNCGKQFGYALLTYFVSRALNFRRVPFCEDRIYASYFSRRDDDMKLLSSLNENRIAIICAELSSLYQHTQIKLAQAGLSSVAIRREIKSDQHGYAETFVRLKKSADLLGLTEVQIEMDTLNSFGDEGAYCNDVTLQITVPIKDVLYCSRLVANRHGQPDTMESGEWVIVNQSSTGVSSLPASSISYRPDMWRESRPFTTSDAEKFMANYIPIVLRPPYRTPQSHGTHGLRPTMKQKLVRNALAYLCGNA